MEIYKPTIMCMMKKIKWKLSEAFVLNTKLSEAFVLNTSIQSINQNLVITNKNNNDYV